MGSDPSRKDLGAFELTVEFDYEQGQGERVKAFLEVLLEALTSGLSDLSGYSESIQYAVVQLLAFLLKSYPSQIAALTSGDGGKIEIVVAPLKDHSFSDNGDSEEGFP